MADSIADVGALSLEEKVGQLLHIGIGHGFLETETGWPNAEMQRVIEDLQPGAVRIYSEHAASPHFMAQYINQIQRWAEAATPDRPPLIACDSEYGTVDIIGHGARGYPSLMGRSAFGDPSLAREVASALASDMLAMGITMTHQPTVDVNTNSANPVIGVRSPGSDPESVSTYAKAALDGIHDEEQVAVAKHFPGHGDTSSDSHHELPHVTYDRETLEAVHLPPFQAMIEEGVDCLMTSHVVVDCLDPAQPATLSEPVLTDILRKEMGFEGIVVTDSMAMAAMRDNYGFADAAVKAIDAGVDLLLTGYVSPGLLFKTRDALVAAVNAGELPESRVDEAVSRILELKREYDLAGRRYGDPLEALETTGSQDHELLSQTAYEQSFSVVGSGNSLPLSEESIVLLTGFRAISELEPAFDQGFDDVVTYPLVTEEAGFPDDAVAERDHERAERQAETLQVLAEAADVAVVTTFAMGTFPEKQRAAVKTLSAALPVVVVSLGFPNEYGKLPDDVTHVATYAQERLGQPTPLPETASDALVETLHETTATDDPDSLPF